MSRKRIIKVSPIDIGEDWVPNTSSIIEMQGMEQVTESSGCHNLENDLVRAFRENEEYDVSYVAGTGESKIPPYYSLSGMNFFDNNKHLHGIWNERPKPVIITGTTEGNVLNITSESFSCSVPCEDGVTLVYNLVPNETYNWSESNTSRSGSFSTEGTVRQLYIDALPNIRDIGGYTCYADDGVTEIGTMRYGKVFRGFGYIPMVTVADGRLQYTNIEYRNRRNWDGVYVDYSARVEDIFAKLTSVGITKELDLRQYSGTYSPSTKGIYVDGNAPEYSRNPQYDEIPDWYSEFELLAYGNASDAGIFKTTSSCTYNSTTSKTSSVQNLYNCLNLIADTIENGGIWYHCKTGADRTGVLTAIIMAICGCSIDDIVKEYEITSFCRSGIEPNLTTKTSGGTSTSLRTFIKNNVKYTSSGSGTFWEKILARVSNAALKTKIQTVGEVIRTQLVKPSVPSEVTDYGRKIAFVPKKFQPSTSRLAIWSHYDEATYDNYRFCEVNVEVGDKVTVVLETNLSTWFIESNNSLIQRMDNTSNITSGFLVDEGQEEFTWVKPSTGVYTYTVKYGSKLLVAIDLESTVLGIDKRYVVVSKG